MNENSESLKIHSKHAGRHEGFPFAIEQWYPILKDFTFKTYFILGCGESCRRVVFAY